jgi:hypothetical protein
MIACQDRSVTGYMNQINLGEVYYKTIRAVGIDAAQSFLQNFLSLPININLPVQRLTLSPLFDSLFALPQSYLA